MSADKSPFSIHFDHESSSANSTPSNAKIGNDKKNVKESSSPLNKPSDKILICSGCRQLKKDCTCDECNLCNVTFHAASMDSLIIGRHHCRACSRAVCSDCRDDTRTRWHPRYDNTKEKIYYCKRCSPVRGLATVLKKELYDFKLPSTSNDDSQQDQEEGKNNSIGCDYNIWKGKPRRGLMLLFEVMPAPRRCIDSNSCAATYTDELSCPACRLPTIPLAPFVEKIPKSYSDPESQLHLRSLQAEMKQDDILAERFDPSNRETLNKWEEQIFDEAKFWHPPTGEVTSFEFRDIIFSCLAASVCYEYNRFPRMMLNSTDCPAAKLMRPIEVHASFTIFETSGDRIIIAFPGTHDTRTVLNDLNAGRTFVHESSSINSGNVAGEKKGVNGGVTNIYGYKVHTGFLRAATLLEHRLPTSTIRRFIKNGKRVILCGHSLGAAIASLVTLRILRQDPDFMRAKHTSPDGLVSYPRVQCIGFGTPLIGNSALKHRIHRAGLSHLFLNVVHKTDIVPRVLTVHRAQQEVFETVKNKVEEVKNKVVAAGSSLMSKISSFFEKKPAAATNESTTTISKEDSTNSNSVNPQNQHKPQGDRFPVSPSLGGMIVPSVSAFGLGGGSNDGANNNNSSSSSSSFPATTQQSRATYFGKDAESKTNNDVIYGGGKTSYVDPSTTGTNGAKYEYSSPKQQSSVQSTIDTIRALDLDDEDIHEVFINNNDNDNEQQVESADDTTTSSLSKTKKEKKSAQPAVPFHAIQKVKSPFDTFGRYLFLAPTREGLQISSPKSSRMNSMMSFPSVDGLLDNSGGIPDEYSAMRVTCMLVEDPAQSFGVLRNTSGSWMKSVEDHLLDGYQKALMMACFKG